MSNSNNLGKELKRLRKELEEIKGRDRKFHFVVLTPGEDEDAKVKQMLADGTMAVGDEYQAIVVGWAINPLEGSSHIPAGNSADPLADPNHALPPPAEIPSTWRMEKEREKRWKKHVRDIEAKGDRYDPKPRSKQWL